MSNTNAFTWSSETNNRNIQYINLLDRGDRLGANLSWYISTILIAIKNKYKIHFIKPKKEYRYYNSIFVEALLNFIDEYNLTYFGTTNIESGDVLIQECEDYFQKIIRNVISIKCDYVSAFKEDVFTEKFKDNLKELAKTRNYTIPFNTEKTIVVHLRLDDRANLIVDKETRIKCSRNFKQIIDNDIINFTFPGFVGQSAINEDSLKEIIDKALLIHKDYEVIIITNGTHTLPYKTINSTDESYDLFLLCNSKVLIGSMSTFSFAAILFGQHESVYYPLWDHAVCFGLTTKYDKTKTIMFF